MNRLSLIIALVAGSSLGLYFGQKDWLVNYNFDTILVILFIVAGITGISHIIAVLTDLTKPLSARLKAIAILLITTSLVLLVMNTGITLINQRVATKGANQVIELLENYRTAHGNYPELLDESIDHPAVFNLIYDRKEATDSYKLGYLYDSPLIFGNKTLLQLYDHSTQAWEKTPNDLAVFE